MRKQTLAATLTLLVLAAASLRAEPAGPAVYPFHGTLRAFDAAKGQATVSHDAVRGYMPAMTMDFDLADPAEMATLRPGDTFSCQLRVDGVHAALAQIHKETIPGLPSLGAAALGSRATELNVGDLLPDIELTNQRGETVHLHDFGGKPLAISFIYLRCPLPTYCPLLNRNFQATQDLLDRLGGKGQVRFLSVSMDPAHDTPAQLAAYAALLAADGPAWTFATAREDAVRRLGNAVGLEFQRQGDGISHNLRTVVADGQGRLRHVFRGNAWTPQELAAELRAASRVAHD